MVAHCPISQKNLAKTTISLRENFIISGKISAEGATYKHSSILVVQVSGVWVADCSQILYNVRSRIVVWISKIRVWMHKRVRNVNIWGG